MRRIICLCWLVGLLTASVAAQDETVRITWPPPVYEVAGAVNVTGTVNPPDLQNYFLEVSEYGAETPLWIPVSLPSRTPVVDGVLAQWVTTLVPDGIYNLRLHVTLRTGEDLYDVVGPIRVANALQRPEGEFVPAATAEPTQPPAPAEPTEVPRPEPVNELPVPVGGQLESFDDNAVEFMRQAGMTWVKWQIPFVIGDFSLYTVARDRITWSHERGFKVLLSITGEAAELEERGEEYLGIFAGFLTEIAAMHPDAIEVWNEMNIDAEWPAGEIDPEAYVEMLRPAYVAIKAADPEVMVITGALSPTGFFGGGCSSRGCDDAPYLRGMMNAGAGEYADCVGIHYNEGILHPRQLGGDPRGNSGHYTRYFQSMINTYASIIGDLPLCFTELGYLSPEGYGQLPSAFAWAANTSVAEQAEWLRDAIQIAGDDGRIALIIIWNVNYTRFDDDPQGGYAIIRPDGTCPACLTIASLRGQ
jgi:hypothetical protein